MGIEEVAKRVQQVNKPKDTLKITIELNGKCVFENSTELEEYTKEVINTPKGVNLYYFFKGVNTQLEQELVEKHKKLIWDNLGGK